MQRYFGRLMRSMIVTVLGFGGGIGLLVFIATIVVVGKQDAWRSALTAGLIIGFCFAVILTLVQLLTDISFHLFLAQGRSYDEIWELQQARELTFEGSLRELVAYCRQALLAVPYVKNVTEDMEHRLIRAAVGSSWRSAGETMELEIKAESETTWKVRCKSQPLADNVVFDYGKNFENVECWLKIMTDRIKATKTGAM